MLTTTKRYSAEQVRAYLQHVYEKYGSPHVCRRLQVSASFMHRLRHGQRDISNSPTALAGLGFVRQSDGLGTVWFERLPEKPRGVGFQPANLLQTRQAGSLPYQEVQP